MLSISSWKRKVLWFYASLTETPRKSKGDIRYEIVEDRKEDKVDEKDDGYT